MPIPYVGADLPSNQFAENYQTGLNAGLPADIGYGTGMFHSHPSNSIQVEDVLRQTQEAELYAVPPLPLQPLLDQYYVQQSGEAYSEQSMVQYSGLAGPGWGSNTMMTSGRVSVRDVIEQPQATGASLPAPINQYIPQQLAQSIPQDYDQGVVQSPRLAETSWGGDINSPHI